MTVDTMADERHWTDIAADALDVPGWDVARYGPVRERLVILPRSQRSCTLVQPADLDRLLDLAQDDPEGHLPYWAELWPSGIALADALLLDPHPVHGQRVLELGCGLGLTAIAALWAGARLVAIDYSAEALALTRWNCSRNTGRVPELLRMNWRCPSEQLATVIGSSSVPVILAADVLYEDRDVEPLLRLVEHLLAPGGLLWLAEPGRRTATTFIERLGQKGWFDEVETWSGPWPDAGDTAVVVAVHRLRRPGR